ncbi:helix-turn-helix domain-containing protein [Streptomyces sp. RTd22]|uniref:helix-turn-helix domain-containing protein n=1 Tax=Streptomyces sp. RTd22 TaxID=1841249 RepID=UPI0007C495E4|nr:helix-turn-helix transcriptional regulator [Streptomyces sp. RTd22]
MPSAPPPDWILARRRAVGVRIRAARTWRNLTQERLGERAGMDRQAMNRIEQGHQAPGLDTLIRIADALDVPLAELVQGVEPRTPKE